ncbi:NAD(P)H-dependent oxidoreductase [Sinomicrobium weinanense]|uniref:NAD(P)H-dependent oxidoreductase n=1 Tax=Sinomicrobium weinanense TaxID=2842200 RepID=A0A926JTI3_9FLAO|nr:NAD(P)H-dependent oxidoreductase [Sinomicrobium weinanense]MBC9797089.1 NAD(P)H-dependent oxidoreductase [Sinomicrobium weinanense]MBU3122682.1 NAD(P)H-dependent oxidoreductase [Sinomicrobium weinanense]
MKHLIIYAHPNPESINAFFKQNLEEYLLNAGHEIRVRDLYELSFNPVLSRDDLVGQRKGTVADDVRVEQDHICWADCITFIHPIWWTGLPAILKGYIDRVFSYGFAYRYDQGVQKGLLRGKQAVIINTQGKSAEEYRETGMDEALSMTSDGGIYTYCGLDVRQHFYFDRADKATPEDIERWTIAMLEVYIPAMSS